MIVSRIKSVTGLSRSRAWRLSSVEYAGQKIEVCFLGSEIQKNFVKRALFPGAADEEYLGVQYFHHLRQLFPGRRRYDLIIAEKHSQDQLPRLNGRYWFMPHWISTFTDLPLTRLSNSFRSDLRLIRKNHLKYRITTDPAELRDFYRQMYLPLVSQSHGDSSIPMQLEELIENIEKNLAELLLVCDASTGQFLEWSSTIEAIYRICGQSVC